MHDEVKKYMKRNAAKGGRAVKKKYGKDYFSQLRKDGWDKKKRLEKIKKEEDKQGG